MKARYIITLLVSVVYIQTSLAQNSTDAYRFSSFDVLGSARFVSLGGAYGSIGGDLSSLNYNPAGLGIYQSSEFTFSSGINYSSTESTYNGRMGADAKANFNIGMLGMASTYKLGNSSGWKSINYGFSMNRIKNFNNTIYIGGESYSSSLANVWRDQANGILPENLNSFAEGLAWDAYVLDTIPGYADQYYSNAPLTGVIQTYLEESKGYVNELSFAFAANYNDKLILGFSLGVPNLNFRRSIHYNEYAIDPPADYEFDEFTYKEELITKGVGVNAKFGFIYIISPAFRINGAVHTPTVYSELTDEYSTSVSSLMGDGNSYLSESPIGNYSYNLVTPARFMLGLSGFMYKNGFFSVDYEYTDYGTAKFFSPSYSFDLENRDIRNDFQATHTLRLGAEWRFDLFTLRGGYNITGSPMNPEINDIISSSYSWGAGYRIGSTYFDFAYSKRTTSNLFYMYNPDYVNPASLTNSTSNFIFTLGYKF